MTAMCNKSRQPAEDWSMNRTEYCVKQSLCHTKKFFRFRTGFPRNYAKLSLRGFPKCETDARSYAQIRWKPCRTKWKNGKKPIWTVPNIMKAGFCANCWKLPIFVRTISLLLTCTFKCYVGANMFKKVFWSMIHDLIR